MRANMENNLLRLIRVNVFAGLNGFILFGLYAIFVSPILSQSIGFEEKNLFVAVGGFVMLLIEPFALYVKIRNARIRAILKSEVHQQRTGKLYVPKTTGIILYGFMARLLLRTAVAMVSFKALGFDELSEMMAAGFLVIDILLLTAVYARTNFFEDPNTGPYPKKGLLDEHQEWSLKNVPGYHSLRSFWIEVGADLVLQIYAVMLFTAFIDYSNWFLVDRVTELGNGRYPQPPLNAALSLVPMYFILFLLCLMPIRIGYWIEDSLLAFSKKEQIGSWISFAVVLIFCFVPLGIHYLLNFETLSEPTHWFLSSPLVNVVASFVFVGTLIGIKAILHKDYFLSPEPISDTVVGQTSK